MIRESCTSTEIRPRTSIVLPERGPFPFGEPYGTTGIRVTNADDGPILACGMSYWANINAHADQDALLVFLGVDRARGGGGPSLWRVDKRTLEVTPLGPIFPSEHPLSWSTGERWYWSATDPTVLYACDLEHLYRVDVFTKTIETVIDITPYRDLGKVLWQFQSSHDGRTHSAVWKDATTWQPQGCIVYREGVPNPWIGVYPARGQEAFPETTGHTVIGDLDECQIDKSGDWLLIKEQVDGQDGEDNRIIRVADHRERDLLDRDGAAGHSDSGFDYMVAADNWNGKPAAWRVWMFEEWVPPQGRLVYTSPWDYQVQHVGHGNARQGAPDTQWAIGSGATRAIGPRANEIVAFPLDGSLRVTVLAPSMVDLDASGGGDDYWKLPKANLDPYGQFALWTSNHGSDRLDGFLVQVPPALFEELPE